MHLEHIENNPAANDLNNSIIAKWLTLPHPRISEREFVLRPLYDIDPHLTIPLSGTRNVKDMLHSLYQKQQPETVRVIPLPHKRILEVDKSSKTLVMGILNVTPDSFSDGGDNFKDSKVAVEKAHALAKEGADIIDVGGESSRPGAEEVPVQEEIERVVPVIRGIRDTSDIIISIDTRHALGKRLTWLLPFSFF